MLTLSDEIVSELSIDEQGDQCLRVYREEQFEKIDEYCDEALKGDNAKALYVAGMLGRSKDRGSMQNKISLVQLTRSAEKGFAPALTAIGRRFQTAQGVQRDYCKAEDFFRKGLSAGDGDAGTQLGYSVFHGYCSGAEDWTGAVPYLEICAADDPPSRVMIGAGILMTGDFVKGRAWLIHADSTTSLSPELKQWLHRSADLMSEEELAESDEYFAQLEDELAAKAGKCHVMSPIPPDFF